MMEDWLVPFGAGFLVATVLHFIRDTAQSVQLKLADMLTKKYEEYEEEEEEEDERG